MKFNVLLFILFSISICSQSNNIEFYGEKFNYNLKKIDNFTGLTDSKQLIKGKILSTCPNEGLLDEHAGFK